jgi:diguanylate cyclase (GGDEF)-like protein
VRGFFAFRTADKAMLVQLLEKFSSEEFDLMAVNLQEILYSHFRRIGQFNKALITRAPVQDYDYEEDDVHRKCAFGQWYYLQTATEIKRNREFVELGKVHEGLHSTMRNLLRKARAAGTIAADDYDLFLKTYNLFTDKLTELSNDISFAQYQFDPLTKLLNRRAFKKILEYEFNMLKRTKRPCAIAMADIDHFKNVNDRYGHASGDAVLKGLAGLFLRQLRGYDTVGRFGGEEFIFCLPNTALRSAKKIMERLRKKVEHMSVSLTDRNVVHVTISIGIAELKAAGAIDNALNDADQALYSAKEYGRNRVEVRHFSAGISGHGLRELT